ncbi:MAG: type II RES/Xre toxin-antitoxin system antitoxin [Candidatus Binatia bacterium]
MLPMESIVNALGGRKVLKRRITNLEDLRTTVKEGLPYASFEALSARLGLARDEAANALHLPHRTIARRKKQRKLHADESDRVLRLARIGAQAAETFGSEAKAAEWLRRPNRALGNVAPLELLDTDIGIHQIEEILGRIEHGLIS